MSSTTKLTLWVAFQLSYTGKGSLYIRNASLPWGKWYDYPDKDREVAAPNGQAIAPGSILYVAAYGRENSPSGTEGTFEIWSSTSKVAHVYFDCPWSGINKLEINRFSTQYLLDFNTAPSSGPMNAHHHAPPYHHPPMLLNKRSFSLNNNICACTCKAS
ncbi:hypothetical protein KP509_22G019500 [Ceratopteris richardii]|uniref:Uncharacterized protein n=1 Tax=Ceratopteris richardii TaxID=49495 RepID=A0A8T2S555_CERRI|nr:hypothetical protein KP509_22G019500 [Ceratopteris richardii]